MKAYEYQEMILEPMGSPTQEREGIGTRRQQQMEQAGRGEAGVEGKEDIQERRSKLIFGFPLLTSPREKVYSVCDLWYAAF